MTLEELNDHIESIRSELSVKNGQLDRMIFSDPGTGLAVRYQIECLQPRLDELQRQARRLSKEREALGTAVWTAA